MAIRIEYLLLLMLLILLLSILGITPISQAGSSPKGDKEIAFYNFWLYDIKENDPSQEISALRMVKYQNYLEMDEIALKDEMGYRLLAKKAIYEDEDVYMDKGVKILRNDGLKFATKSLKYNIDTKDIKTIKPFILEFNSSIIQGENLFLNFNNKKVMADNIEAKIVFVETPE